MKRFSIWMVLIMLGTISMFAQKKVISVSGRVLDTALKEPVSQATVQLLSVPDSAYVVGLASGTDGKFTLPKDGAGKYLLKVSYIGLQTKYLPVQLAENVPNKQLGDISLDSDAVALKEAVVTAQAPPVVVREDTIEYSAAAYPVPEGSMLEELIKKIPGVEIDDDGKITLNGKEIKKIMVDGKEFFSDDPQVSMKNLPANIVEKVKAYEKQSDQARYTGIDDGEEEPVLDLGIKKGMKQGWIGNLIAGYGNLERYESGGMISRFKDDASISIVASANNTNNRGFSEFGDAGQGLGGRAGSGITTSQSLGLNFAKETEKIKVEGNVHYGHSVNDALRKSSTETFLGEDMSTFEESKSASNRDRHDARMDVRFEWRPDTMTTIVFRPNLSYSHTESDNSSWTLTKNNDLNPVNENSSSSTYKGHNWSFNGNLMFFRRLNSEGRNIHVGARFGYSDNESDSYSYSDASFYGLDDDYTEAEADSISEIDRYTNRNSDSRNWSVTASYTEPIFKYHFLQLRYQFSHRKQLSQSLVYDSINYPDRMNFDYDNDLSTRVENFYDTHTAEISIRGIYPKMMYSAGVAATPQSSLSKTTIGPNYKKNLPEQNVLNWSPSVMFRYKFSKQHVLNFRYRGRSSEPNISDLQEVIDITDPMNMRYGNPGLKPSFSNNFDLRYNRFFPEKMSQYNINVMYSNTLNAVVDRMIYNPQNGSREYHKENVNGNWSLNTFWGFNTPFKNQKFTISLNGNARYSDNVSYTSVGNNTDQVLSTTHNLLLAQRVRGSYRSDAFDMSLNGSVSYNLARNSMQTSSNRETFDYLIGGDMNVNLPWDVAISTDLNYRIKEGYADGLDNNELMWNAQISKSFLKGNAAMVRIKFYDILQQQSNLSRTISATMISDTEYNTLGSYFMVHFVYRFNTFGKGGEGRGGDRPAFGPGGPRGGRGPMGGGSHRF